MQIKTFVESCKNNKIVEGAYAMLAGNIYMSGKNKDIKSVVVTSCNSWTGKTSTATNLAIVAAAWGKKTLLIDLDLRKPSKLLKDSKDMFFGITDYLNGRVELEEALCKTNIESLTYLGSGKLSSNPIGLLCSDKLQEFFEKARKIYDLILIDTPSLNSVSDATVISSKVDAVILVEKIASTNLEELARAMQQLEKVDANLLGVVLNNVKKNDYRKYFGEYDYYLRVKRTRENRKGKDRESAVIA